MMIGANFYNAVGLFGALGFMLLGLFSTYPAVKAYERGSSFIKWYVFSFLLFPLALVASFAIHNRRAILKK